MSRPDTNAYSREGIAKTAQQVRNAARKRGETMTAEESKRRVREAIRKTPITRD